MALMSYRERQARFFEDGSGANGEHLLTATAAPAVIRIALTIGARHLVDVHVPAAGTGRCLAPSLLLQKYDSRRLADSRNSEGRKDGRFRVFHDLIVPCISISIKIILIDMDHSFHGRISDAWILSL